MSACSKTEVHRPGSWLPPLARHLRWSLAVHIRTRSWESAAMKPRHDQLNALDRTSAAPHLLVVLTCHAMETLTGRQSLHVVRLMTLSAVPCQAHELRVPSAGLVRLLWQCTSALVQLDRQEPCLAVQTGALLGPLCTPCLPAQLSQSCCWLPGQGAEGDDAAPLWRRGCRRC